MTANYLTTLVIEDAARREPIDLPVRMHYLHNRFEDARDAGRTVEMGIVAQAMEAVRNGLLDAWEVVQDRREPDGYRMGDGGTIMPTSR